MIKTRNTSMSKKSRPVKEQAADPAEQEEVKEITSGKQNREDFDEIDNQYEAAGFAISTIFKNWKKFLILIAAVLIIIGIILLLLLPGYKCQTETRSFEKSPVNLPGKSHRTVKEGE
jgi:hypothetical protein